MSRKLLGVNHIAVLFAMMFVAACASNNSASTGGSDIVPGSAADLEQNIGNRVYFALDSSTLDSAARAQLQKQAQWLQQWPSTTIRIEGNCDERGTREYNLALGDRRANAVRDYLVSQGIDGGRVQTISFGKDAPSCGQSTESCWSQNRNGTTALTGGAVGS